MINTERHDLFFDRLRFTDRIDVVGCGAVGSKIVMELAKLGISNIHVWDADDVESHNISNQAFYLDDIGKPKVDAMKDHVLRATGIEIKTHNQFIEGKEDLGRVVFLCVDTMSARKSIFENCLKHNFITDLTVEVRMGIEELRVYGFNPCSRDDIIKWEQTLVDDSETVESACGSKTTVGAIAGMTAAFAVVRFMQWFNHAENQPLHFEQIVITRPLMTIVRN